MDYLWVRVRVQNRFAPRTVRYSFLSPHPSFSLLIGFYELPPEVPLTRPVLIFGFFSLNKVGGKRLCMLLFVIYSIPGLNIISGSDRSKLSNKAGVDLKNITPRGEWVFSSFLPVKTLCYRVFLQAKLGLLYLTRR